MAIVLCNGMLINNDLMSKLLVSRLKSCCEEFIKIQKRGVQSECRFVNVTYAKYNPKLGDD